MQHRQYLEYVVRDIIICLYVLSGTGVTLSITEKKSKSSCGRSVSVVLCSSDSLQQALRKASAPLHLCLQAWFNDAVHQAHIEVFLVTAAAVRAVTVSEVVALINDYQIIIAPVDAVEGKLIQFSDNFCDHSTSTFLLRYQSRG